MAISFKLNKQKASLQLNTFIFSDKQAKNYLLAYLVGLLLLIPAFFGFGRWIICLFAEIYIFRKCFAADRGVKKSISNFLVRFFYTGVTQGVLMGAAGLIVFIAVKFNLEPAPDSNLQKYLTTIVFYAFVALAQKRRLAIHGRISKTTLSTSVNWMNLAGNIENLVNQATGKTPVPTEFSYWNEKTKTRCAGCGRSIPAKVRICPFCGSNVKTRQSHPQTCQRCRGINPADSKFCIHCGINMEPDADKKNVPIDVGLNQWPEPMTELSQKPKTTINKTPFATIPIASVVPETIPVKEIVPKARLVNMAKIEKESVFEFGETTVEIERVTAGGAEPEIILWPKNVTPQPPGPPVIPSVVPEAKRRFENSTFTASRFEKKKSEDSTHVGFSKKTSITKEKYTKAVPFEKPKLTRPIYLTKASLPGDIRRPFEKTSLYKPKLSPRPNYSDSKTITASTHRFSHTALSKSPGLAPSAVTKKGSEFQQGSGFEKSAGPGGLKTFSPHAATYNEKWAEKPIFDRPTLTTWNFKNPNPKSI